MCARDAGERATCTGGGGKYVAGTVGDALCAEVVDVVLKVLGGCAEGGGRCALYVGSRAWCALCAMGTAGHALHAVRCVVLYALQYADLYAARYSGGRGGQAPFAKGAALRAVSCAPCAGGREGRAACAVGAVR